MHAAPGALTAPRSPSRHPRLDSFAAGLLTTDAVPNQPGRSDFARLGSDNLGSAALSAEIPNLTLVTAVKDAPDGGSVIFHVWLQAAEL